MTDSSVPQTIRVLFSRDDSRTATDVRRRSGEPARASRIHVKLECPRICGHQELTAFHDPVVAEDQALPGGHRRSAAMPFPRLRLNQSRCIPRESRLESELVGSRIELNAFVDVELNDVDAGKFVLHFVSG